jgi:PAS domain S-box-containing protein
MPVAERRGRVGLHTATGPPRVTEISDRPERAVYPDPPVIGVTSMDLGGNVVFVTDRSGTIVDVNDAFVRVTGYSRREAIGASPRLLSSGHQDDRFYAELWETITRGEVWEGQLVDQRRDGALRTHHVTISPVQDDHGVITHFVAVERDMTGELARQVAVGSAGLLHTDREGRTVYADGRAAALLGLPPSQLLGSGLLGSLVPEDADALREVIGMAAAEGREHRLDVRSREGSWFSVEVAALTVASGATIGAVLALEDVTDQMAIHGELARRDALVTSVLEAIPDAVAVVAADGTVLAANAAWRTDEETLAPAARRARVGDDLPTLLERAAAAGDAEAGRLGEQLERALKGDLAPVTGPVQLSPLRWEEGGLVLRAPRPEADRSA